MARILAVDDERAILDALARVLGRDGHEVVRAADPTAVPGMDLSRFDLVLCDVMMPGLDGFELVRQIRPDFDGPIIFLTARVAEEDAVAGYGLGADDYVRKPFGAAELRAKVAAHLRRERRPRSHALSFGEVRIDTVNAFFTNRDCGGDPGPNPSYAASRPKSLRYCMGLL
ncbi:response regulator transcription factor [Collinsella phocaeensis]|uniref:response regulator transcription factor n=1 Tax=Collinsella phocaeensis TaxID=1871016 RepID=UPI000A428D70|nr:response regulator transcription factor [Collinsella phocaeensis]